MKKTKLYQTPEITIHEFDKGSDIVTTSLDNDVYDSDIFD